MTTFLRWLNSRYVIGLLLLIGATVDLILIGQAYDLSKSDWAAWVAAAGTVGALLGTIYLATTESRRKHRRDKFVARLHAIGAYNKVAIAAGKLSLAEGGARTAMEGGPHMHLDFALRLITEVELWTIDELLPLAPIAQSAIAHVVSASSRLHLMQTVNAGTRVENEEVVKNATLIWGQLQPIIKSLAKAQSTLYTVSIAFGLDRGGVS